MKKIIQLSYLDGYDEILETERQSKFQEFNDSSDPQEKREALAVVAMLTAARSPEFVASYEKALGIDVRPFRGPHEH